VCVDHWLGEVRGILSLYSQRTIISAQATVRGGVRYFSAGLSSASFLDVRG
jgi:hypothetical protein